MLNAPCGPDRPGLRCIAMLADPVDQPAARLVIDPIGRLRNLPVVGASGPTPIAIGALEQVLMLDGDVGEILPIDFADTAYDLPEPEAEPGAPGTRRLVVLRAGRAWHVWILEPGVAVEALGSAPAAEVALRDQVWISQGDTLARWVEAGWSVVPAGLSPASF